MNAEKNTPKKGFAYGWSMVLFTAILFFFCAGISTDGLNVTVPAFAAARGWDHATLLAISTPAGWVGLLGTVIFSQTVAKWGSKRTIVVALLCCGAVCFLYGAAPSVAVYAVTIALACFFSNGYGNVTTGSLIASWFPRKRGYALGWASMGLPIATAVFVPLFGMLIGKFQLSGAFAMLGAAQIALGILAIFWVKNTPEEIGLPPDGVYEDQAKIDAVAREMETYQSDWTVKRLLTNKTVWIMSVAYGLLFLVTVGLVSQMVPRLMGNGYEQNAALGLLSFASVAGIVGSYFWGLLDVKITTKKTSIIFAGWYVAAIVVLLICKESSVGTLIGCGMAGVGIGGIGNLQPSMLAQIFGRFDYAAASRVVNTIVGFIRVMAFAIVGIAITLTGSIDGAYGFLIAACIAAGVLLVVMDDKLIGKAG